MAEELDEKHDIHFSYVILDTTDYENYFVYLMYGNLFHLRWRDQLALQKRTEYFWICKKHLNDVLI